MTNDYIYLHLWADFDREVTCTFGISLKNDDNCFVPMPLNNFGSSRGTIQSSKESIQNVKKIKNGMHILPHDANEMKMMVFTNICQAITSDVMKTASTKVKGGTYDL